MPTKPWSQLLDEAGDAAEEWTVLPAGDYDLKVVKSEASQSANGKLMFKIRCQVTSGPNKGKMVFDQIVVTPDNEQAMGFFFRKMATLGIDKTYFARNPGDHQVAAELVGREFRGQIGIRQYQGSDRNQIDRYYPIQKTDGPPAPVAPAPVPQATNQTPTDAAPTPTPAPANETVAAASAATPPPPPAPAPAAPAPAQPETPPVPDTPAPEAAADQPSAPPAPPAAPADPPF